MLRKIELFVRSFFKKMEKKGLLPESLINILIAVFILILLILAIIILTGRGQMAIEFIKGVLRLG